MSDSRQSESRQREKAETNDQSEGRNQGEGDRASARRYAKHVENFTQSHDTEALAREAEPETTEEAAEMTQAERSGRKRAKEFDPQVSRER